MPKKQAKNAYFYFMIDFRDEQKQNGVNYANMTEVQQAADPVWRVNSLVYLGPPGPIKYKRTFFFPFSHSLYRSKFILLLRLLHCIRIQDCTTRLEPKSFLTIHGVVHTNFSEFQASHPSVRAKYENKAKQEKAKYNVSDQKYTSTGVPFSEIENRERLVKEALERELRDIQNFVQQNTFNSSK